MNRRYYCLFVLFFWVVLVRAAASEGTFNILFIQSYTSQTPWHNDLNQGLVKGFRESGVKVNITTEYLDADFWAFKSEKVIMHRFCERARERKTDLIVTSGDEAFYTLLPVEIRCRCKFRSCFSVLSILMRSSLPLTPMSVASRLIPILILSCVMRKNISSTQRGYLRDRQ